MTHYEYGPYFIYTFPIHGQWAVFKGLLLDMDSLLEFLQGRNQERELSGHRVWIFSVLLDKDKSRESVSPQLHQSLTWSDIIPSLHFFKWDEWGLGLYCFLTVTEQVKFRAKARPLLNWYPRHNFAPRRIAPVSSPWKIQERPQCKGGGRGRHG